MLKATLAAAVIAAAGFAIPAHAIPASSPATSLSEVRTDLIQVRNHNRNRNWKNRGHRNWKRGHRANRHQWHGRRNWHGRRAWRVPPRYRGWHRYGARPWNWRARGCVIVGPVWFCP